MPKLKKVKSTKSEEKEVDSSSFLDQPRFLNKTMEELFWDAKGFKQCLWTIYEKNNFKALTDKQLADAWYEFNKIEKFTMDMYGPKIEAMEGKKEKKVETIEKSSKEVNALLNAPNLKKLKRIKTQTLHPLKTTMSGNGRMWIICLI